MQEHHKEKITPRGIALDRTTTRSERSYQTKGSAASPCYDDLAHFNLLDKEKTPCAPSHLSKLHIAQKKKKKSNRLGHLEFTNDHSKINK